MYGSNIKPIERGKMLITDGIKANIRGESFCALGVNITNRVFTDGMVELLGDNKLRITHAQNIEKQSPIFRIMAGYYSNLVPSDPNNIVTAKIDGIEYTGTVIHVTLNEHDCDVKVESAPASTAAPTIPISATALAASAAPPTSPISAVAPTAPAAYSTGDYGLFSRGASSHKTAESPAGSSLESAIQEQINELLGRSGGKFEYFYGALYISLPETCSADEQQELAGLLESASISVKIEEEKTIRSLIFPPKLKITGETLETLNMKLTEYLSTTNAMTGAGCA